MSTYKAEYYEKNKERLLANMKAWREANPERAKAVQTKWKAANEGHTYADPDGYVKYIGYEHPAAAPSGITGHHRIILWDKLQGQDAPCHWCGMELFWSKSYPYDTDALVTDHVNNDKQDNRPENLVPSCNKCNISREGGRKQNPNAVTGPCSVSFCDRDATIHVGDYSDYAGQAMCKTHYQHVWLGKEPQPIRKYKRGGFGTRTAEGRECMTCGEFKPYSEYYLRTSQNQYHAHCKPCMVQQVLDRKARRLAKGIKCSMDDCSDVADLKGLCSKHYHIEWAKEASE